MSQNNNNISSQHWEQSRNTMMEAESCMRPYSVSKWREEAQRGDWASKWGKSMTEFLCRMEGMFLGQGGLKVICIHCISFGAKLWH